GGRGWVRTVTETAPVATGGVGSGENDNLRAPVVTLAGAELLVLFPDVDGLYHEPPRAGEPLPPLFDVVEHIGPAVVRAAGGSERAFGRGGMSTKLEAARAAARCGASTVVCNGRRKDLPLRVAAGRPGGAAFP